MTENLKIDPYGFREYDARWLYNKDINLPGITNLGKGLGSQIIKHTKKNNPRVIVGHDYRSYSEEIKTALKKGLVSTGCFVEDIGLSLSPMVYFAQFNLDSDAVAMVTASHNENGWTGVKMGIKKGLTHAPEEMKELKEITLKEEFINGQGNEKEIKNFQEIYKKDLISERHRHRYEVNLELTSNFVNYGLVFSGMSPDNSLPEVLEIPDHPWFVGVQFHPELKSKPFDPHPLFSSFINASLNRSRLL